MKGNPQVIEHLNILLGNELVAINQYFLHSRMQSDWGFEKLAAKSYEESIDEMKHAQELTDRILLLGGLPNYQDLGRLKIGQNVLEQLQCDLKLEEKAIPDLIEAIKVCEQAQDYGTRDLLATILRSEEEHRDWLETQLNLFEQVGEQNYLQTLI